MIDEFQDTSRMQYENFKPLLDNAQSQGQDCLIVGDAKQSIYRFRNSDSTLLTTQLTKDFTSSAERKNLEDNWRSVPEIVDFKQRSLPTALLTHPQCLRFTLGRGQGLWLPRRARGSQEPTGCRA